MISVREALAFILNHITVGPETVAPTEEALGCVPADNVREPNEIPLFTRSNINYYAAKSADTVGAFGKRPVIRAHYCANKKTGGPR